MAKLADR